VRRREREKVDYKHVERRTNTHAAITDSVPRGRTARSEWYQSRNCRLDNSTIGNSEKEREKERVDHKHVERRTNTYPGVKHSVPRGCRARSEWYHSRK
jgi:hypothetical protein